MSKRSAPLGSTAGSIQEAALSDMLMEAFGRHQQGRLPEAEVLYRRVLRERPRNVDAMFGLGTLLSQTNQAAEAIRLLERAVKLRPDHAEAHGNLARAYRDAKNYQLSLLSWRRAHALAPGDFRFHYALGATLLLVRQPQEAREVLKAVVERHPAEALGWANLAVAFNECFEPQAGLEAADQAIALDPILGDAHVNRAISLGELARFEECASAAENALRCGAPEPNARFQRGVALLTLGQFAEGWRDFEWRLPMQKLFGLTSAAPQWRGQSLLQGRRLLVRAEQGLGDTLQFCRFAPRAAALGAEVILEVQPLLESMMRRNFSMLQVTVQGAELPDHDLQCPLMSLPLALDAVREEAFVGAPYLKSQEERRATWRRRFSTREGARIGLVCSGNPDHAYDALRSLPLSELQPALSDRASYYLVQKEVRRADRATLKVTAVTDLSRDLGDFEDTAACLAELDLLISVDTSVAHLAGALGTPTWLLTRYSPDFRWQLSRGDSPWYSSMRLYRQSSLGGWRTLIQTLHGDLTAFLNRLKGANESAKVNL